MKKDPVLLVSGRMCRWECPQILLLRHYFVLTFPQEQGEPTTTEETEMIGNAIDQARHLAADLLKNPSAFVLIRSGESTRRVGGWHVHIVLVSSRWQKAWLYFVLSGKNILQAIGVRRDRRQK